MAKDTTEGRTSAALRRDFHLPAADERYLDSLGLPLGDRQGLWLTVAPFA
jgi:hypothetical protein